MVEISSVGKEISSRLMVPGAYRTLFSRAGGAGEGSGRFTFFVNARARDIFDVIEERSSWPKASY